MDKQSQNIRHISMFFVFSVSAGIIQAITFTFLYEIMNFIYWPSYLIALLLSVVWNFTLNRKFTFKSAANIPVAMIKVALFYAIFTPLSTWIGNELTNIGWNAYILLLSTMITNLLMEFIYTKYFVYHNKINTALEE